MLALGDGLRHRDWVPDLIVGLGDANAWVRFNAAPALGRAAPDPAVAVPPLIAMLRDPDVPNRQVAAKALADIGRSGAGDAVPALARVLETDGRAVVRDAAVRALWTLAVWNPDAISALVHALDDAEERVREVAVGSLFNLGVRAGDAVPALRRVVDNSEESEAVRSEARRAADQIVSGAPAYRQDEPYRSLNDALSNGRFLDAGTADEVRVRLEQADFREAFEFLEAGLELAQDDEQVWRYMFLAARELDRPVATRYFERFQEASGTGGYWVELLGVVHSPARVSKGMRRIIRYCSRVDPHRAWKRFNKLQIDEDLVRLKAWLETAFAENLPPVDIPGLWFGLTDIERDGEDTFDMHLSAGQLDDQRPDNLVIGGSWQPPHEFACSGVLDQIHKIAHANEMEHAEYHLTLAYGALAVRWLAMTLNPELLLGGAPQRVLAVGFHDGDSIGVGTLRSDGLAYPGK